MSAEAGDPVVVVGSGASGVHFAATLLSKGRRVRMLDFGLPRPQPMLPDLDHDALKARLDDPVEYFLGRDFGTLILPGRDDEYYGFPPNKRYVFERPGEFGVAADGFVPLMSFAAGGLAEAWTAGCYPFGDDDLAEFPFGWSEIEPFYTRVAKRIGMTGVRDDMERFFPLHDGLDDPLELDEHSRQLIGVYERQRSHLNARHRCYLGRSRLAVLARDRGERRACSYLGRCLWGCPHDALYTPSVTLRQCLRDPNFEYVSGVLVDHFRFASSGRVTHVVAHDAQGGARREFEVGSLALAAGTLCTSKILLESVRRDSGECVELGGLMDNRQVLMPFVNMRLIGRGFESHSYQYHQLALGIEGDRASDHVHGLITTLKTALIHPVVQTIPASLGASLALFRNLHSALGLLNINFSDHRRDENRIGIEADGKGGPGLLQIVYRPEQGEDEKIARHLRTLRRALLRLGCIAPRSMTHLRPMGSSVHYAGVVPMKRDGGDWSSDPLGRCRGFDNLYLVDGTTFPSLPAKNLTFTLMANATRIAEQAF